MGLNNYNSGHTKKRTTTLNPRERGYSSTSMLYVQGVTAEYKMSDFIKTELQLAGEGNVIFIPDVCYKTKTGNYAQVDLVILSTRGFFCVEFKSWTGTVYPSMNKFWEKQIGDKLQQFNNPMVQNSEHCRMCTLISRYTLQEVITDVSKINFRSLVVFDDNTKLLNNPYPNVMYYSDVADYILQHSVTIDLETLNTVADFIGRVAETNKRHFVRRHRAQM